MRFHADYVPASAAEGGSFLEELRRMFPHLVPTQEWERGKVELSPLFSGPHPTPDILRRVIFDTHDGYPKKLTGLYDVGPQGDALYRLNRPIREDVPEQHVIIRLDGGWAALRVHHLESAPVIVVPPTKFMYAVQRLLHVLFGHSDVLSQLVHEDGHVDSLVNQLGWQLCELHAKRKKEEVEVPAAHNAVAKCKHARLNLQHLPPGLLKAGELYFDVFRIVSFRDGAWLERVHPDVNFQVVRELANDREDSGELVLFLAYLMSWMDAQNLDVVLFDRLEPAKVDVDLPVYVHQGEV